MTRFRPSLLLALFVVAASGLSCRAAEPSPAVSGPVTVHPASLELHHPRQPHSLQVLGTTADGYSLDLRDQARFASADPRIAAVDERGWVRPVGGGRQR